MLFELEKEQNQNTVNTNIEMLNLNNVKLFFLI